MCQHYGFKPQKIRTSSHTASSRFFAILMLMEKIFSLKTKDAKKIQCTLNTSEKGSNTVVVFVHGLTGHPNDHSFYNAAQTFPKKGVDVFRPALYWWEKGNRMLHEFRFL